MRTSKNRFTQFVSGLQIAAILALSIPGFTHAAPSQPASSVSINGQELTAQTPQNTLEDLVRSTASEMDRIDSPKYASDFTAANVEHVQEVHQNAVALGAFLLTKPNTLSPEKAEELGVVLFERLGKSIDNLSEPFVDLRSEGNGATTMQKLMGGVIRLGQVIQFWLVPRKVMEKFGSKKEETVVESWRRTGVLQDSVKQVSAAYDEYKKTLDGQLSADHPFVKATERLLRAAGKAEPHVNRLRTRVTLGVALAGFIYFALAPRELHVFAIDFFLERTWGSYLVARAFWGIVSTMSLVGTYIMTGHGVSQELTKLDQKLGEIPSRRKTSGSSDGSTSPRGKDPSGGASCPKAW